MAGYDSDLKWLDGPGLVAWIEAEMGPDFLAELGAHTQHIVRRIYDWKHGRPAQLDAVDRILCTVGIPLAHVPDELWIKRPPFKPPTNLSDEQKIEAVKRVNAGERPTVVAESYGCVPRAIQHWRRKFNLPANPNRQGGPPRRVKKHRVRGQVTA